MSMASAAPFSGLSLPANRAPVASARDHGMQAVGTYGGRIASTGTTARQAVAWKADTVASVGGEPRLAARRSAAETASLGGRWSVWRTGASSRVARLIAGASKAWLWMTSYRSSRTAE